MKERDDDLESVGSDFEQIIAMLEKAEIDYEIGEDESTVQINGEIHFAFTEEGDLKYIEHAN